MDEYIDRYETIALERRDHILQVTFHTDGGPLRWGPVPHREWPDAFGRIAADRENRVVIMTGTGDEFSGPAGSPATSPRRSPREWETTRTEGTAMLMNLLAIEAPIISAINGPALRHMEVPLLADIVLASEHSVFTDSGHFVSHTTPGDGMHIVMPLLMGLNRARYFLYTGQRLSAHEARDIGLVNEVLSRERLLPRAWELAEAIADKPPLVLRHTRLLLTQQIRQAMHSLLGYGLALEGLGVAERWAADRA
jgi:enoyl-CoA hydratase/carnithine racemase